MGNTKQTPPEQARRDARLLQNLGQEIDRWPRHMKGHAAKGKANIAAACKTTPQPPSASV